MARYAEWIETRTGGRNNRIIKGYRKQSRRIYDENDMYCLVHDQDGPIWIPKTGITIVEKDEGTQV